jgi:hypothetical protein
MKRKSLLSRKRSLHPPKSQPKRKNPLARQNQQPKKMKSK